MMVWGKLTLIPRGGRAQYLRPICSLSAGPVMYSCGLSGHSQDCVLLLSVPWHSGPLQPPVPPYRYPAARHHVLLIYCYTGFHN